MFSPTFVEGLYHNSKESREKSVPKNRKITTLTLHFLCIYSKGKIYNSINILATPLAKTNAQTEGGTTHFEEGNGGAAE